MLTSSDAKRIAEAIKATKELLHTAGIEAGNETALLALIYHQVSQPADSLASHMNRLEGQLNTIASRLIR